MAKKKVKYYTVQYHQGVIFDTWAKCKAITHGQPVKFKDTDEFYSCCGSHYTYKREYYQPITRRRFMSKKSSILNRILTLSLAITMLMTTPVSSAVKVTMDSSSQQRVQEKTSNSSESYNTQLIEREKKLERLEKELKERQEELDEREKLLDEREKELEQREDDLENYKPKESDLLVDGGNLKRIGNVTDEQVNAVEEGFNQLPELVQETLVAANYRVEVTDEDIEKLITGTGTNSWYGASAASPLWVILVANNQKTSDMTRTMIHECGHCYDDILGNWSLLPVWKSCYATEAKTLYDTALVHNEKEWFAECFVFYLTNPDYLKSVAPNSYTAIDTLFKDLYKLNGKEMEDPGDDENGEELEESEEKSAKDDNKSNSKNADEKETSKTTKNNNSED